jgi:hypothetical protein
MATTSAFMVNPPQIESPGDKTPASASQQGQNHASFRRQRASRACEVRLSSLNASAPRFCKKNTNHRFFYPQTCHARKVRCDAASLGGKLPIIFLRCDCARVVPINWRAVHLTYNSSALHQLHSVRDRMQNTDTEAQEDRLWKEGRRWVC